MKLTVKVNLILLFRLARGKSNPRSWLLDWVVLYYSEVIVFQNLHSRFQILECIPSSPVVYPLLVELLKFILFVHNNGYFCWAVPRCQAWGLALLVSLFYERWEDTAFWKRVRGHLVLTLQQAAGIVSVGTVEALFALPSPLTSHRDNVIKALVDAMPRFHCSQGNQIWATHHFVAEIKHACSHSQRETLHPQGCSLQIQVRFAWLKGLQAVRSWYTQQGVQGSGPRADYLSQHWVPGTMPAV